jgi:hypothetical protein
MSLPREGGMMVRVPWLSHPLTEEQVRDHFMRTFEDDTEDAPWMAMGGSAVLVGFWFCP